MEPILSVRNLKTYFYLEQGVVRAVDGLSYDLYPSKTLAVVGESGCGKSVHALSILRLIPQPPGRIVSGEILFQGKDLLGLSSQEMRQIRGNRIAMIFQEPMTSLNPVLTIGDQIMEALILHQKLASDQARQKAAQLLKKVGIPQAENRLEDYPHQFSGGMRQRVMIAMALACDPDILIADEPTTALDVTIQAQILELIRNLQKEMKMAVILITHNIGVVAKMADEVVVMYAARAVEKTKVETLFAKPKHPYTQSLLRSIPSIFNKQDRLRAIPGQPPELTREFEGCPFADRCPEVMEKCRHEDPLYFNPSPDHMVNCWLHEKQDSNATLSRS
ncbi:MAG: ABC transporter ATP-binding protein [Elusimicrobia bacterium]|nr:ABC transporter ATP-binding protein [Elusimicrobiota bacterium]